MNDGRDSYKNLGDLSAVEPWAKVGLYCDDCKVQWVGCMDAAPCPECDDHKSWGKLMEVRGHYK